MKGDEHKQEAFASVQFICRTTTLQAAIAGGCDFVVSFNERNLGVARSFGIEVLKPVDLLKLIGENK
jgi:hypothetical protein